VRAISGFPADHVPAAQIAEERWRHDASLGRALRLKSAAGPALTTQATWAQDIVAELVQDIAVNMLPTSTLVQLRALSGLDYEFQLGGNVRVPGHNPTPNGSFVAEAAPLPYVQLLFSSVKLEPRKAGALSGVTEELTRSTPINLEISLRQIMSQDLGLVIDGILLDANARDAVRPAGIRNGIVGLTPAAATGSLLERVATDVHALLNGIAPTITPCLIASAPQIASLQMAGPGVPLINSFALTPGTVIAVDAAAFVSALGSPSFLVSENAMVVETNPGAPISSTGGPNVVSAPERSYYQTDALALRTLQACDWSLRRSGAVSWMSGTNW
jgi:hypothetical protein